MHPPAPVRVNQDCVKNSRTNTGLLKKKCTIRRRKDVKLSVIISGCLPNVKRVLLSTIMITRATKNIQNCKPFQMSCNNMIMVSNHWEVRSGNGNTIKGLCPSAGIV